MKNRKNAKSQSFSEVQLREFKPLSQEQATAYELCWNNAIVFLTGMAGCGKTHIAVAYAVDCAEQTDRNIILTRPAVEACGESLGALPGGIPEKLSPFLHPLTDTLREYAPHTTVRPVIVPLAYMRGRTFKHSIVLLDEAQNATLGQLRMILTRIGEGSTIIVCGDWDQSDIRNTPLKRVVKALSGIDGIAHIHMSRTEARHPLIPKILDAMSTLDV